MSRFLESGKMFTEEEIKRKRARIHRKMLKSGTTPDLREGKPDLRKLFELYDKNFFRGQIERKLDATNSTLDFTYSKHTSTAGTCSKIGCKWKINIPIKLFQGLFQKGEKNLLSNGIWCTSKLDCLQLTFEHELIHFLMGLYQYQGKKPEYTQSADTFTGHGKLFQCMAFLYFGHTDYRHDLFKGEASTKLKKGEAQFGMRIKFFNNKTQEEYHGRITKINPKRAVILLDDGREWRVPYTMLERSDKSVSDVPESPVTPNLAPVSSKKDQFKVGMRVTYFHKGKDYYGVITRINPKKATVQSDDGTIPLVPYHMLKETDKEAPIKSALLSEPLKKNIKDELSIGDWVQVKWKDGGTRMGKITKKNPSRTKILMEDGKIWNVPYQNITGEVDQKNKFDIGDKVSYVINWKEVPGLTKLGIEIYQGTIVEKTPTHAMVKSPRYEHLMRIEYSRLTKI
jgi:hypothetical protein